MRKRFTLSASLFVLCATLQLAAQSPAVATSGRVPGTVFRDCPDCPEMVVVPAGKFTMGSSASEKSWAASHGGNLESVADESPQHQVSLRSFAMGKYDVTRGEYAAFVRETGYPAGDGCGPDSFKWNKQAGVSWQNPGFSQTDRDPVVCVSWQDARAYVAWLNSKVHRLVSTSGDGPYRLPSESEWGAGGDDDAVLVGRRRQRRIRPYLVQGQFRRANSPRGIEACEPFRSLRHGGQCLAMDGGLLC